MDAFFDYLARYPAMQILVFIAFVLALLFVLKKFFKMAVLTITVAVMCLLGYYFFTSPGKVDERMKSAFDKTKHQSEKVMDTGKKLLKSEADEMTKDTDKLIEKRTKSNLERKKLADDFSK